MQSEMQKSQFDRIVKSLFDEMASFTRVELIDAIRAGDLKSENDDIFDIDDSDDMSYSAAQFIVTLLDDMKSECDELINWVWDNY